ncbi:unnamed protein product [Dovyalis caffra]|uniref:VQ domain-containing protein n=1 Tax=Dovyalis caffra TaxID=77055 RepID=A0AAV1SCY1_9ROSI|nr:unnamed protein product [Dovyalis caffra]
MSKNYQKQQFSNLIKVLRPKVYITDASKFKTLVQELTGNGKATCISNSPPETTPQIIEKAPFIDIKDQEYDHHECSMETSVEGFDLCNVFQTDHQVHCYNDQQAYMHDISGFDDHMSLPMNQREEFLAYQDLESWLLSSEEPCSSSYNGYYAHTQQQLNMYDYASYPGSSQQQIGRRLPEVLKRIFLELPGSVRDIIQLQFQKHTVKCCSTKFRDDQWSAKPTSIFAFPLHIAVTFHAYADEVEKRQLRWTWETSTGNLKDMEDQLN